MKFGIKLSKNGAFDVTKLREAYHRWRRRNFPVLKKDLTRRDDLLNARLDSIEARLQSSAAPASNPTPTPTPISADSSQSPTVNDKVRKLLKYGVSYAEGDQLHPPVGVPSQFFDYTYFSKNDLHSWWKDADQSWWREEIDWDEKVRLDTSQLPDAANREGYLEQYHFGYWISGYRDYRKTLSAVEPYGVRGGKYFDFGGSSGRVFRHFAFQSDKWDVWSSDFKPSSVEFNLKYFPKSIKSFLNNSLPSLPLPDDYFDLVTAYSVFTHINEAEIAWLLELRRILKVGGVAFLSIHDEATWLNQTPYLRTTVQDFRPDIADLPVLPKGKTVVTWREDDPYNCNVFHSREYIANIWGRFFEICEVKSQYHDRQAVVICRRLD